MAEYQTHHQLKKATSIVEQLPSDAIITEPTTDNDPYGFEVEYRTLFDVFRQKENVGYKTFIRERVEDQLSGSGAWCYLDNRVRLKLPESQQERSALLGYIRAHFPQVTEIFQHSETSPQNATSTQLNISERLRQERTPNTPLSKTELAGSMGELRTVVSSVIDLAKLKGEGDFFSPSEIWALGDRVVEEVDTHGWDIFTCDGMLPIYILGYYIARKRIIAERKEAAPRNPRNVSTKNDLRVEVAAMQAEVGAMQSDHAELTLMTKELAKKDIHVIYWNLIPSGFRKEMWQPAGFDNRRYYG